MGMDNVGFSIIPRTRYENSSLTVQTMVQMNALDWTR